MTPEALRDGWRMDAASPLAARRAIAGLSLLAMASLGGIALYQLGISKRLPDPPLPGFHAGAVHGSREAYALFALPDAILGLGSYAVTLALATAGDRDRARKQPWLPLTMTVKLAFDIAQAGRLLTREVTQQRALSCWSLIIVGATMAAGPRAIPEVRAAARYLLRA
jgi:hypothetical protein